MGPYGLHKDGLHKRPAEALAAGLVGEDGGGGRGGEDAVGGFVGPGMPDKRVRM